MTSSDFWSSQADSQADVGGSEPFRVIPSLWRFKWMIIVVTVVAAGLVFAASLAVKAANMTPHQATKELLLKDPRVAGVLQEESELINFDDFIGAQRDLVVSTEVLGRASEAINGRYSINQLNSRVEAKLVEDRDAAIKITATDDTIEGARQITSAVSQAYEEVILSRVSRITDVVLSDLEDSRADYETAIVKIDSNLVTYGEVQDAALEGLIAVTADLAALGNVPRTGEVAQAEASLRSMMIGLESQIRQGEGTLGVLQIDRDTQVARLADVIDDINQLEADITRYGSGVYSISDEESMGEVPPPSPKRNAALAGILGFLGASVYAWWLGEQRRVAGDRHDAARILGVPLLGVIPDLESADVTTRAPTLSDPGSTAAEAYHFVASSMERYFNMQGVKIVLVTSADFGDGRTVTALNLAVAIALGGRRVILVDGDRRTHGLTNWSNLDDTRGMTDLTQGVSVTDCIQAWPDAPEDLSLRIVSAGTEEKLGSGLIRTAGFGRAFSAVAEEGDIIVVDGAPILAVADALTLAARADGLVLVVPNYAPVESLKDARERLSNVDTPILGYVFNSRA